MTLSVLKYTNVIFMVLRFFTVRLTVKNWQLGCQMKSPWITVNSYEVNCLRSYFKYMYIFSVLMVWVSMNQDKLYYTLASKNEVNAIVLLGFSISVNEYM
jgi:hypothetical protein